MQKTIWISAAVAAIAAGLTLFILCRRKKSAPNNHEHFQKAPGQTSWEYTL